MRQLRAATTRVELSLDEVDVVARGRVVDRFVELEAELTKGNRRVGGPWRGDRVGGRAGARGGKLEAALAALNGSTDGAHVSDSEVAPRRPARRAKAAKPTAVSGDEEIEDAASAGAKPEPRLVVGKTAGVLAEDTLAEAGRKVMRFHLARMLDREPGVREGKDIEDIHKMRVATRRQRAAWRVFGESFRKGRTKPYREGLRDAARSSGPSAISTSSSRASSAYRADQPVNGSSARSSPSSHRSGSIATMPAPC